MKVSGIFDAFGALILLAIVATLAAKPDLVRITFAGIAQDIRAATLR